MRTQIALVLEIISDLNVFDFIIFLYDLIFLIIKSFELFIWFYFQYKMFGEVFP